MCGSSIIGILTGSSLLPMNFAVRELVGSQMIDSVYFADRIVIPYKPRLTLIHAGGNDLTVLHHSAPKCIVSSAF